INIGRQGEIKEVSPGFARNYLIPQSLAMEATVQNLRVWEKGKSRFEKLREEEIGVARKNASKMEVTEFFAKVKIGRNGKIFGSITTANLVKIFNDSGFKVSKHDILLSYDIKELGSYKITVRFHPEVVREIKLSVISD
ncbi:MAG: 50S ribosomal protein L9, partial [Endomicrobium sp.]|nr:50S ribosomal protein L9 [Endomicrobium sp.]